ncbi:hypothetical protein [Iningainema tapete]|uniref:Uncharacterized protein n=1 Tax=Iningainema tapete BLCC-T55 TaxID=2748662 RepID=A0A8J7C8Z4_9CYAN|nr:hypothetical protein [Iningainema tapete]MBD2777449.1 hypothetical protein [Iningainema tapete BLCC-T55]
MYRPYSTVSTGIVGFNTGCADHDQMRRSPVSQSARFRKSYRYIGWNADKSAS